MSLTSVIRYVRCLDSTATDGSGKTGLAFGDITAKYAVQGGTLTSLTTETIITLGTYQAPTSNAHIRIKELANTNPTKGVYEVHLHNDLPALATTKLWLFFSASGAAFQPLEMDLSDISGRIPTALATGGGIKADLISILGTALTETAGLLAGGFKKFFNVATPTGTVNSIPDAVAGAANGLFIAGTNAPVTITGSGNALTLTSTGGNGHGLQASGNGTGNGFEGVGGANAGLDSEGGNGMRLRGGTTLGHGLYCRGDLVTGIGIGLLAKGGIGSGGVGAKFVASTDASGLSVEGAGAFPGLNAQGGATGAGIKSLGGATSGDGIVATGNGTSKHGIIATGGTAGTSDGIKASAGTGGVDIRGNITGNLVGTVSTLTTYTGNTPQSGDCFPKVDTEIGTLQTSVDDLPTNAELATALGTLNNLSAAQVWALADGIENGVTPKQAMQRIGATTAGQISGAGTGTEVFIGLDGLTTRVTVSVDNDGNRTSIIYV